MSKKFDVEISRQWRVISEIHNITKELYIKSEEYNDELCSFVQPIKEMKDAYEHVVRAQSNLYSNEKSEEYISKNLSKALGHEYRAFFDTADFMGIILRNKIYDRLSRFEYNQIISAYPEYENVRVRIMDITDEIAELRIKKDVGSGNVMRELIVKYRDVIYELLSYYRTIETEIYPKLENQFGTSVEQN